MLAVKTMLVLGFVLLWGSVAAAAEEKSIPDSTINDPPRKSGKAFLSPDHSSELFLMRNLTPRIGMHNYYLLKKPELLAFCAQLAVDLDNFRQIAGVPTLQEALSTGVEFLNFSKDFTTYGYPHLHTGFKFPMIESKNLKTGIFYSF
jgi:hypothetical protein